MSHMPAAGSACTPRLCDPCRLANTCGIDHTSLLCTVFLCCPCCVVVTLGVLGYWQCGDPLGPTAAHQEAAAAAAGMGDPPEYGPSNLFQSLVAAVAHETDQNFQNAQGAARGCLRSCSPRLLSSQGTFAACLPPVRSAGRCAA